jgi:nucleoside 2-deoxyribosyltransferase
MSHPRICLIGDIVVDVTLKTATTPVKLRLGGIVHAARALWALNIPYSVGYFAPSYLDSNIHRYLKDLGCSDIVKLGNVTGAPAVFLIEEVKEVGDQGYDFLLRDEISIEYDHEKLMNLKANGYEDCLVISGNYDLRIIIEHLPNQIHVDLANNIENLDALKGWQSRITSIFLSTSSALFRKSFAGDFKEFAELFRLYTVQFVLKENRGGSRAFNFDTSEIIPVAAQTRPIVHSVGVGDAYDAVFVSGYRHYGLQDALVLSSWIAGEYASTTYPDDFKTGVQRILASPIGQLKGMQGVYLPWELRPSIHIYIAAPDFSFVNTGPIDVLEKSLRYHNFTPRRPIKENGEMESGAGKARRQELVTKDMLILHECRLLVGVLLYDDPGTYMEIGYAAAKDIPTIVFDPCARATNCMLTELPTLLSNDMDEIIAEIFIQAAKL